MNVANISRFVQVNEIPNGQACFGSALDSIVPGQHTASGGSDPDYLTRFCRNGPCSGSLFFRASAHFLNFFKLFKFHLRSVY